MTTKQIRLYSKQNFHALKEVTCSIPYTMMHIEDDWGSMMYCCGSWMPHIVGNVNDISILSYLKSTQHDEITKSFNDGTFSYCDKKLCPSLAQYLVGATGQSDLRHISEEPNLRQKKEISLYLNYDRSCNLQCPSCRTGLIRYKTVPDHIQRTHDSVVTSVSELLDADYMVTLAITGSGDPFASIVFLDMLKNYNHDKSDNYTFALVTNGVLMTDDKLQLPNVRQRVKSIDISIDAATAEVYAVTRKNGNFEKLKRNLANLNMRLSQGFFTNPVMFKVNFIISSMNFREIIPFTEWVLSEYDQLSTVWFNLITDWGHFGGTFDSLAVWKQSHPDHYEFLEIMKHPILKNPKIMLGNAASFSV